MNKSEYKLLMDVIRTDRAHKLFTGKPGQSDPAMEHLIDLGHVERSIAMNDNYAERVYAYRATASGREAADEYRVQRSERRWTRGLALAAVVISLLALLLEMDDRGFLGGTLNGFKTSQSERPAEEE